MGSRTQISQRIKELGLEMEGVEIINPSKSIKHEEYVTAFYQLRQRKGITRHDAERLVCTHNVFGMMMVRQGDADGLVSGLTQHYPYTVRPALQIIGKKDGVNRIAGMYMLIFKNQTIYIADATVNIGPTAEDLAEIALLAAEKVRQFNVEPRIAMLSFSNFGSSNHPLVEKVQRAVTIVRKKEPSLMIDGEMQADTAVAPEIVNELYPFSVLKGGANLLVCPDHTSANISTKLLMKLGGATAIGPILLGIRKPVYLLIPSNDVNDIVNITAMSVFEAQRQGEQPATLSGAVEERRAPRPASVGERHLPASHG